MKEIRYAKGGALLEVYLYCVRQCIGTNEKCICTNYDRLEGTENEENNGLCEGLSSDNSNLTGINFDLLSPAPGKMIYNVVHWDGKV